MLSISVICVTLITTLCLTAQESEALMVVLNVPPKGKRELEKTSNVLSSQKEKSVLPQLRKYSWLSKVIIPLPGGLK